MTGVLVRNAEVEGRAGMSVRVRAQRIVEVGPALHAEPGETLLDAAGGAVMPGLHDHHVHLRSLAAARRSVRLDPDSLERQGGLAAALSDAGKRLPERAWLRGVGLAEVDDLERYRLDTLVPDRPVRLQHRGGSLWLLNSRAIESLGVDAWTEEGVERLPDGTPTGRLWRLDERLGHALGREHVAADRTALRKASLETVRMGITGLTDATPAMSDADIDDFAAEVENGHLLQRLLLMAEPGTAPPLSSRIELGARKVVLDDDRLPAQAELRAMVSKTHELETPVAFHCVTATQLAVLADALQSGGVMNGDRVEHAGVVPPGYADLLARLGVGVVTQPGFIADRGENYLAEVPAQERGWLYPCRSLLEAGVAVAIGSDAPFGPLDPWRVMRAATQRVTSAGQTVGPHECITASQALDLYLADPRDLGRTRRVAVGESGDLCVLGVPLPVALDELSAEHVTAVVTADRVHPCR